ncbi:hypothetical protein [Deinococcus sp. UYEF24]
MTSGPSAPTLTVIGADRAPTSSDAQLLSRAQAVIEADPHFKALTGAILQRGEVNAGVEETESGYLYLRYDVPGAVPQEFWAHWGKKDHLSWSSGQVSVKPEKTV